MLRNGCAKNSDFFSTASTFPVKLGNFDTFAVAVGSPTGIFPLCHQYEKGDFSLPAEEKSALEAKTSGSRRQFTVKTRPQSENQHISTKIHDKTSPRSENRHISTEIQGKISPQSENRQLSPKTFQLFNGTWRLGPPPPPPPIFGRG
jgi:hypothetical protein